VKVSFRGVSGLVIVRADLQGPQGRIVLRIAVDTGTTYTTIDSSILASVGIEPGPQSRPLQLTTALGIGSAFRLTAMRFKALGEEHADFPVISHRLPPVLGIDGVLGLDFFRNRKLTIDFRNGFIELE
jgi:hypothetical protein